jgi:hypothetical protein
LFVLGNPFQPSLVFAGMARAYPANIRLGWKGSPGTNILAYYKNMSITAIKCFITLAPGADAIKRFISVIYEFFLYDRVFVRIGWKGLPGTNTLAFYKNM